MWIPFYKITVAVFNVSKSLQIRLGNTTWLIVDNVDDIPRVESVWFRHQKWGWMIFLWFCTARRWQVEPFSYFQPFKFAMSFHQLRCQDEGRNDGPLASQDEAMDRNAPGWGPTWGTINSPKRDKQKTSKFIRDFLICSYVTLGFPCTKPMPNLGASIGIAFCESMVGVVWS